ncbi:MAG: DHA2 family efflux MFS transporter permease subunit [Frankia sp.]|nr:DHA2 family efflux MFS transporter permease subunit [Frankia sp.]
MFAVVIAAVFVTNLDLFVVNVALPEIGRDYDGASLESLSWVLNGYALVYASLLVVSGRLADRYGHRPGFLLGLVVFTAGSALCAAAPGTGWLIGARVVQAVGAAVLLPTSLALLLATTPQQRRVGAVRAWSAVGGLAAALGPVLGGLLAEADWRWIFLINIPVGVLAFVLGTRVLPDVGRDRSAPMPDLLGAAMLTIAIGALSLGLVEADTWTWADGRTIGCLIAAAVLTAAFVFRSARHRAPVVELPMLRIRAFSAATVASLLFSVAFAGMLLSSVLWLQDVWGYSVLKAGLAVAPGPLVVPPLAVLSGALAQRIGVGRVAALGNVLFGLGVLSWALLVGTSRNYAADFLPGMIITGLGVGLALPTVIAAGATAVPPARLATGSAVLNMSRQVGAVLGVAVLVTVLGDLGGQNDPLAAFRHGWYTVAGISVAGAIAALVIRPAHAAPASAPAPASVPVPAATQASEAVAAPPTAR